MCTYKYMANYVSMTICTCEYDVMYESLVHVKVTSVHVHTAHAQVCHMIDSFCVVQIFVDFMGYSYPQNVTNYRIHIAI